MRRAVCVLVIAAFAGSPPALHAQPAAADPDLAKGINQVRDGDFETAVLTLDGVVRRLSGQPGRSKDLAQAHLHLGIALVGLGQQERADASFREAVTQDRDLRLSPERFSPKVIAMVEAARRRVPPAPTPPEAKPSGSKALPILLGLGAAAGIGVAVAGGGGESSGTGGPSFTKARFEPAQIECPNGSISVPLPVVILVDVANDTSSSLTLSSVSTVLTIVASTITSEIGNTSNVPSTVSPTTVLGRGSATLRVATELTCGNGTGDAARFNEWSGQVAIATSAGTFNVTTTNRLHIDIP